jgi:extracellular factor (EF) 3-hydroxypalmitic acid methyl ester biosynthesis protein
MTNVSAALRLKPKDIKHYEDLPGASGKHVNFRPERTPAKVLFPQQAPKVLISGISGDLVDVSLSGFSFIVSGDAAVSDTLAPQSQHTIALRHDEDAVFVSPCRVVRLETVSRGVKVAVAIEGGSFEKNAVSERFRSLLLQSTLRGFAPQDFQNIPADYRDLCAEFVLNLRQFRAVLESGTGSLPAAERVDVMETAVNKLMPYWDDFQRRANAVLERTKGNEPLLQHMKDYTERMVTTEFMDCELYKRSFEKPLGYPGDFIIMGYLHNQVPFGKTLYQQLINYVGAVKCAFVPNRSAYTASHLRELLLHNTGEPLHVLNLGAGAAVELQDLLRQVDVAAPLTITLIDQDKAALDQAHQAVYPLTLHQPFPVAVNPLQTSFVGMVQWQRAFGHLPPQDLIYSLGLLDYLDIDKGRVMIEKLVQALRPGGILVFANMASGAKRMEWNLSFLMDWVLQYRSEAETRAMFAGLPVEVLDISQDATEQVWQVALRKIA